MSRPQEKHLDDNILLIQDRDNRLLIQILIKEGKKLQVLDKELKNCKELWNMQKRYTLTSGGPKEEGKTSVRNRFFAYRKDAIEAYLKELDLALGQIEEEYIIFKSYPELEETPKGFTVGSRYAVSDKRLNTV